MLETAVNRLATDDPDGKRRLAGVQVKPMFDYLDRWVDVVAIEARPAA